MTNTDNEDENETPEPVLTIPDLGETWQLNIAGDPNTVEWPMYTINKLQEYRMWAFKKNKRVEQFFTKRNEE